MSVVKKGLMLLVPIGLGYAVMKAVTPSEEQTKLMVPKELHYTNYLIPEDQKAPLVGQNQQKQARLSKSELIAQMLKENMESNRPAWDVQPVQNQYKTKQ